MKKILTIAICAITFASCTVYQYTGRETAINRQDFQATPTIVDVKADFTQRVSATSDWQASREEAMAQCRYLAITQNNIDIVVDPIYQIQCRPHKMRKKYKAVLTGFAGTYTNARTPLEDIENMKKYSREDIENYLLIHNSEIILPYLYQQPVGDVINLNSNHSKGCKPDKAIDVAPQPQAPAPAPARGK